MNEQVFAAFFRGPHEIWYNQISHDAITWWTHSEYSHVEIVLPDGLGYSSAALDGGVRSKYLDLDNGKWDLVPVYVDESRVRAFYAQTKHLKYDWAGIWRYPLPWLYNSPNRWYCSEWCAAAIGLQNTDVDPGELHSVVTELHYKRLTNGNCQ